MFNLKIETNNAAFDVPYAEVVRILRELAGRINATEMLERRGNLRDINGNIVGEWEWHA